MIIVEERPLLTAPAVRGTPAREHPAAPPAEAPRTDREDGAERMADAERVAGAERTSGGDRLNGMDRTSGADRTGGADRTDRPGRPCGVNGATGAGSSGATAAGDPSLALAMASIRISRGNPTAEETAALAVLLAARLRLLHEASQSSPPTAGPRKLPAVPRPTFRPPGAWAS
ncbi:acyl-CoA carboxylase epsilon subunit [Streptomyces subrutilus]|uniref:acyl-CoA carboxylase epsilon subunit n=1 Tax=Streptomyces subrutilus TaxID=36818 RepID=UPI0033F0120B